jgi:hypothetical protein
MITETNYNRSGSGTENDNLKGLKTSKPVSSKYGNYDSSKSSSDALLSGIDANKLNAEALMSKVLAGFSGLRVPSSAFKTPKFGPEEKGDDDDDDIITQLIKIIMGVIKLPVRFGHMFQALMDSTTALASSVDGLGKSVELGTRDIITLLSALAGFIFKYWLCILSFIITTIFGCALVHVVSLAFSTLYLIFPLSAYVVAKMTGGFDIMPMVDAMFVKLHEADDQLAQITGVNVMKWPELINKYCYTCFGKPIKFRDVITDVDAITEIGNMISYDFTKKMPRYMRPGIPPGKSALRHLDYALK